MRSLSGLRFVSMSTLHIFNPETDYALATGRRQYTPPGPVRELRRTLAALPAIWAGPGDAILLLDDDAPATPYLNLAGRRGVRVIKIADLQNLEIDGVSPWGWNAALASQLRRHSVAPELLPGEEALRRLRELAHRRLTIPFQKMMSTEGPLPVEIGSAEELRKYLERHPDSYLKAPWSSSGRGVVHTLSMSADAVMRWGEGIMRRQGSVMAEVNQGRLLDFAAEWSCSGGEVEYQGLSVFRTNSVGRYEGNLSASEDELLAEVCRHGRFDVSVLDAQRRALEELVAPNYDGPVGIDMLVRSDGSVNPCVEVNLRQTMGMAAQRLYRLTGRRQLFRPLAPEEFLGREDMA